MHFNYAIMWKANSCLPISSLHDWVCKVNRIFLSQNWLTEVIIHTIYCVNIFNSFSKSDQLPVCSIYCCSKPNVLRRMFNNIFSIHLLFTGALGPQILELSLFKLNVLWRHNSIYSRITHFSCNCRRRNKKKKKKSVLVVKYLQVFCSVLNSMIMIIYFCSSLNGFAEQLNLN